METPRYNYLDDNTLLYMGTLARLPTYERYLGTQTITRSTPEIYWCSTFHQSRKFLANKRKKIHLLYCGLSGHSLYISWANIFHLGISLLKGMQLSWWIIMHLNSCFSFRFHRIPIINVAPTHHILLPATPVQLTVHRQWHGVHGKHSELGEKRQSELSVQVVVGGRKLTSMPHYSQ